MGRPAGTRSVRPEEFTTAERRWARRAAIADLIKMHRPVYEKLYEDRLKEASDDQS